MRLLTLGGLALENVSFGRVKPLLLLTYLALEGPKERRYLAQLFWPGASDPMNSLSAALTRLRKSVGAVEADEVRVWTKVTTDTADLLSALGSDNLEQALTLYNGPFLHGAFLSDWSVELEEWVYATREDLAERVRRGSLKLAEREAAGGHFAAAARRAEVAHTLDGAPEYEPEELTRLHLILQAGESPLAARVRDEATAFDLELSMSTGEARARLQRVLVGRQRELARLEQLEPGAWAWVRGGAGMGKTALLKSVPGVYLPGRSGLPYATLEPLIGDGVLQEGEAAILQRLLRLETRWLIDNWSRVDEQSRRVLTQLRELRPRAGVVIASRERPPFPVDAQLELGPIPRDALSPDTWNKTQGLPALVEAHLRGEPLEAALEARLSAVSPDARDAYLALALLDAPDIALVRRALSFSAAVTAHVLEELLAAGLVEPSGQVRVRQAAQEYLEARPTTLGPLCLKLARVLSDLDAFPLFERSRHLWAQGDEAKAVQAYLAWADELLRRGFPQQAFEVLEDAPQFRVVTFLKARALERAGRYQEAFECTTGLADTPEVLALKSVLFYRLGKPEAAKAAAEGALEGSLEARAEGMNTLGHQARYRGEYEAAAKFFRRAAALWQAQGSRGRWADALNNIGIALGQQGADFAETEAAFQEALEAAGDNQVLRVRVLINLGVECERRGDLEAAAHTYLETIALAEGIGAIDTLTQLWNNLGWVYHRQDHEIEAEKAYRKSLQAAQQAGDREMLGTVLGNLAELTENLEAWEEAIQILATAGQQSIIEELWAGLPQNHLFRQRSGSSV